MSQGENQVGMVESGARRLPWTRILAEGVIIVVSILLAFVIDAWWDDQGFRRQEQAYLVGMSGEFDQAAIDADSLAELARKNSARFTELQTILAAGGAAFERDSTWSLARQLWFFNGFDPVMPVYGDLVGSTGLQGVQSDGVREALREYERLVGVVRGYESYMSTMAPVWELTLATRVAIDSTAIGMMPPAAELAADLEFRNLLAMRSRVDEWRGRVLLRVAEAARGVQAAIRAEVD